MAVTIRKYGKWTGDGSPFEVDIRTRTSDDTPIRERVQSPVMSKEATKLWASQREMHLALKHGIGGCRCKAHDTESDQPDPRLMTVKTLVEKWLVQRKAESIDYVEVEEQRLMSHVVPHIGKLKVLEVRPRHAYQLVQALKRTPSRRGDLLAPRTVRGIFFTTRQVFQHAVLEEIIAGNPIVLARGVLPGVEDKDPSWRIDAVFNQDEVERLISDDRIPPHRRVAYAIEFLTGLRTGEVSALRWGDYQPNMEPLGRMVSAWSYDSKKKVMKATKTRVAHVVPVHPTLAKVLGAWRVGGWAQWMKRQPKDEDLIIPTAKGNNRDVRVALQSFYDDLDALGLRRRRHYDSRATFISLCQEEGASPTVVETITHSKPVTNAREAFLGYSRLSWRAKCAAVQCMKCDLREGTVVPILGLVQREFGEEREKTANPVGEQVRQIN